MLTEPSLSIRQKDQEALGCCVLAPAKPLLKWQQSVAGSFALNEIRVLLDNRFAASRSCHQILEAMQANKQSNKPAPLECLIKEALPMQPYKSALWERFRPNVPASSSQVGFAKASHPSLSIFTCLQALCHCAHPAV